MIFLLLCAFAPLRLCASELLSRPSSLSLVFSSRLASRSSRRRGAFFGRKKMRVSRIFCLQETPDLGKMFGVCSGLNKL
jgi:hypothetical protein